MSTNPALIPSGGSLATPQSLAATNDSDGHKQQHILIGQSGTLNVVALANSAPAGTEYGLITRNIPSGAQPVTDNGGSLTVDAPVGTPVYNRLSDGSAALIGQKAMAGSLPVVIASDQGTLNATDPDTTSLSQNLALGSTANAVTLALNADSTLGVQITGTWTGTLIFEASIDGTNYFAIPAIVATTGILVTTATTNGSWQVDCGGYRSFRIRCSVVGTGTAVVSLVASVASSTTSLDSPLPPGTNYVGRVRQTDGTNDLTHLNSTPAGTEYALPVRQVGNQSIARQNFFSLNTVVAGVAVVATEAMLTLTPQRNGTTATAGTSFAITTGRTLRIQSIILSLVGAATASHVKVFLRYNPTGAVTTASTMIAHVANGQPGAANNLGNTSSVITFADGLDIPAGAGPAQIGLSQIGSTANTTIWVTLIGYEV